MFVATDLMPNLTNLTESKLVPSVSFSSTQACTTTHEAHTFVETNLMLHSHHPVRVRSVYETASFRMQNEWKGARVLLARSPIPPTKRRFVGGMDFQV
jgi:hypothetical protein